MDNQSNNIKLKIIILALIVGVSGGLIGSLALGIFYQDQLSNYFPGDLPGTSLASDIVSRYSRKVVVEQNTQVLETIDSAKSSIVGLYKKRNAVSGKASSTKQSMKFDLADYYQLSDFSAQGLIMTSDGWIVVAADPIKPAVKSDRAVPDIAKDLKTLTDGYVAITYDKKVYPLDKAVIDPLTDFIFIHLTGASELPVKALAEIKDVKIGQLFVLADWRGRSRSSYLVDNQAGKRLVNSSDRFLAELELTEKLDSGWAGVSLFSLDGSVVGMADGQGMIKPVSSLVGAINSLLKNKAVSPASLGVSYLDLVKIAPIEKQGTRFEQGVMIYKSEDGKGLSKDSAAYLAGLREGDIIIQVNDKKIGSDYDLAGVIQGYAAGEKITLSYRRDGENKEIEVKLAEL